MKYIMTALFITSLSFGAFAEGESNAKSDIDCCKTGKCGSGLPQCGLNRDSQKRDTTLAVKKKSAGGGKGSTTIGQ